MEIMIHTTKLQMDNFVTHWGQQKIAGILYDVFKFILLSLWRHQMETFSVWLALCARNSPATVEFPAQRPVTQSFNFSMIYAWINSKQSWSWWFETPSRSLWRHCNANLWYLIKFFLFFLIEFPCFLFPSGRLKTNQYGLSSWLALSRR